MMRQQHTSTTIKLVASDGFHFSGSGLLNDIFGHSGYFIPSNIRADELFSTSQNFSWPRALSGQYTISTRLILLLRLFKSILVRIPLNILQQTPLYSRYLVSSGRGDPLHRSSSVNRSIWSYLVSIRFLFHPYAYDQETFHRWLRLKYRLVTLKNSRILLDNGIPRDPTLIKWLFSSENCMGIYVFRNPRVQYHQILGVYKSTGKVPPSYKDFLLNLISQYHSVRWLLDSNFNIIFVSFDNLLNDSTYQQRLNSFFASSKILEQMQYDYTLSLANNQALVELAEKMHVKPSCQELEDTICYYHDLFASNLDSKLSP